MKDNRGFKISQYACAVLLIVSSIALVTYQVVHIDDVAGGLPASVLQIKNFPKFLVCLEKKTYLWTRLLVINFKTWYI